MIKFTAMSSFAASIILSIILFFTTGFETAISCLFGGTVMVVNLFGLSFLWKLIFSKKSIALAVLVIIFKYLILGLILWNLNQIQWIRPLGFVLGLGSLMIGVVTTALLKKRIPE
jgi:hypothetical protein